MPRVDPHRWQRASPDLDWALDLDEPDSALWLVCLRARDASLAADVEALLEEHRAVGVERFLDHPVAPLPVLEACPGATLGAYTLVSPIGRESGLAWSGHAGESRSVLDHPSVKRERLLADVSIDKRRPVSLPGSFF